MSSPSLPHRVTVERQRLRFAAGHFAVLSDELEPIHGHNYDVFVDVSGALSERESWVIDFALLKRFTREICQDLDHKFLLQMQCSRLSIRDDGDHYLIQYQSDPAYRLPKRDVAALPIDNSTAERLAEYIASELRDKLAAEGPSGLVSLSVGVEEMPGQAAWYSLDLSMG